MTTCPYVDSNYIILLQDFYCRLSKSDPNKLYNIWVHGLGMTKVYFQIGMIVDDTEVHNKIFVISMVVMNHIDDMSVIILKLDVNVVKCQQQTSDAGLYRISLLCLHQ